MDFNRDNFNAEFSEAGVFVFTEEGKRRSSSKWFESTEQYKSLGSHLAFILLTTGELNGVHQTTRYVVFKTEQEEVDGSEQQPLDV